MTLDIQLKIVYGTERIYPVNETAKKVAALLGRKTITKDEIAKLKDLGFSLNWVAAQVL